MNTWPNGFRHAMDQSQHEAWSAKHYPGTRQLCALCSELTGRCEEDALYAEDGSGPYCEPCWHEMAARRSANAVPAAEMEKKGQPSED